MEAMERERKRKRERERERERKREKEREGESSASIDFLDEFYFTHKLANISSSFLRAGR